MLSLWGSGPGTAQVTQTVLRQLQDCRMRILKACMHNGYREEIIMLLQRPNHPSQLLIWWIIVGPHVKGACDHNAQTRLYLLVLTVSVGMQPNLAMSVDFQSSQISIERQPLHQQASCRLADCSHMIPQDLMLTACSRLPALWSVGLSH